MNTAESIPEANDSDGEIVGEIEELVADFGLRAVVAAVLKTEVGDKIVSVNPVATQRVIQFLLREIVYANNARLQAEVMAIGCGIFADDGIVTKIALKHGITKQAVSKRVVAFCDEWKLPPSAAMKSAKARGNYRTHNQPKAAA